MNWIQSGIALTTLVAAVGGGVTYFAKDSDLKLVDMRLEQKIKADERYQTQQRLWQLQDRYTTTDCSKFTNDCDKAECRLLKLRLEILNNELNK